MVAGSGVYYSYGERALAAFVVQQQMPTVIPIWDRGSVLEPMEPFMGVIGAATGGPRLLPDADLVILAGAAFDYRIGQLLPPAVRDDARVIRIDVDQSQLRRGLEADLSIAGAPANVLAQLVEACERLECEPTTEWMTEAGRRRDDFRKRCLSAAAGLPAGTNASDVVLAIREVLTDDAVLLVDGGNIGQWFHQLLLDRYPGHWVTCGASGVVGWGLPGAVAARALYPDRPVILLSGDGSFTFTVAELECAARQRLPIVAVVADDQQWGISVSGHVKRHGEALYSMLGPTRLDLVAEGFGCRGVRVEQKEQLPSALRDALASQQPTVIHVPIVPGSPAN
jgi:acetolactate synthase-1/2/3 large subunit